MRRLFARHLMPLFMILTLLWSSQGQGYGYVWCVAEDGQTRLESVSDNHCAPGDTHATSADSPFTTFGADDDACGSCLDLAATHDTLQNRIRSGCELGAPLLLAIPVRPLWAPPVVVRQLDANLILESPPRIATTLLVHRTTVLLI